MNTLNKGKVRYVVFKDGATWYAVGLEFNIVESGDDPQVALINLFDALTGYVESCRKIKGTRLKPLNQDCDQEYEKLWSIVTSEKKKSPFKISTYGFATV